MGYISFVSRAGQSILHNDLLWDENDSEGLPALQVGDSFTLLVDIDQAAYDLLSSTILPGVSVRRKVITPSSEEPGYEVEIEFVLVKKVHQILRDWMLDDRGFRTVGVTIFLQSVSDEGERLFLYLQSLNDAREKTLLKNYLDKHIQDISEEGNG